MTYNKSPQPELNDRPWRFYNMHLNNLATSAPTVGSLAA